MDTTYDCYWKDIPLVLDIIVQKEGTQPPAGYTLLGQFTHPGDLDELGYSGSHVIYHHLQELLYAKGRTDYTNLHAKLNLDAAPGVIHVTGVTAAPTVLTLAPGATHQLDITVLPGDATDKSFACVSNTPAVATVSPTGLITAVAAGTATITVLTTDGGFDAESTITVKVAVASVAVNEGAASEMQWWGSKFLSSTVLPADATNKNVTWTTDKPTVVDLVPGTDGAVSANGKGVAGVAVITVTSADDATKKATHTLTVKEPDALLTIPAEAQSLAVDAEVDFTVVRYPAADADQAVTVTSSDPAVATVVKKSQNANTSVWTIKGIAAGTADIVAKLDSNAAVASTPVTFTVA